MVRTNYFQFRPFSPTRPTSVGAFGSKMAAASVSDLLASAFSSTLSSTVVTYDEYKKDEAKSYFQPLDIEQLFNLGRVSGNFGDKPADSVSPGDDFVPVFVKTLTGMEYTIYITGDETVETFKARVEDKTGTPLDQQRLIFTSQQLEDHKAISDYGIERSSTIHLVIKLPGGEAPCFYIDDSLLDPAYDYDFTRQRDDGTKFYRGGYEYHRPYGWKRYALKVLGKYENDRWLGKQGIRADSSEGEWPVSYHGTGVNESGNIAQEGFDMSKGKRFLFGRGIYSTPSIEVAAKYAQKFTHKGTNYQIVFQHRVNPADLKVIDASATGGGEYWVQPHPEFMRPYGICIQHC